MARYSQTFTNSCGAVALMCAASELGVDSLPASSKWTIATDCGRHTGNGEEIFKALLDWNGQPITGGLHNGGVMVERAIYAVTSGDLESYSLPSRIVNCAKLLGLKPTVYMGSGLFNSFLKLKYPNEVKACESQGVPVLRENSPGPGATQRELVVLRTWGLGLHYVMRRPKLNTGDDEYMDPGDGQDFKDFNALDSFKKNYGKINLSIMLETA